MPQPEPIETLVLGGGNGGMYLAWHMARSGRRTAVVERRWIGGSCPNTNCLPSKNEIWSAKVADLVHHAASLTIGRGSPRRAARAHAERARGSVMTSSLLSGLQEGRSDTGCNSVHSSPTKERSAL
jgi:pyruvate/2-oxoglutarate dehydrogenase complex dihydrolipoamide dehydrogenase (E3) component